MIKTFTFSKTRKNAIFNLVVSSLMVKVEKKLIEISQKKRNNKKIIMELTIK